MQKKQTASLTRKLIAGLLALAMTLTMFTFTAFAGEDTASGGTQMCTVTVTNGASSADIEDEAYNSLHVYDKNDPEMTDFFGTKEFPVGTEISYYPWPNASDITLTVVHNGETIKDKVLCETGGDYEPETITLAGDLTITTEAVTGGEPAAPTEYTLTIVNKVGGHPSVSLDDSVVEDGAKVSSGNHTILVQGDYVTDELMEAYVTVTVGGAEAGEPTEIGYDDAEFADVNINGDIVITIAPFEEPAPKTYSVSTAIGEDVEGDVMIYMDEKDITGSSVEVEAGKHSFTVYGDYSDGQEEAIVTLTVGGVVLDEKTDLNGYTGVEFTDVDIDGDVVISVSMPVRHTVSYENKVAEENVTFNVMTVDFSGDAPAPAVIGSGDALKQGSYVGVQVLNPLDRKLIVTQYNASGKAVDSCLVDEASEAEEGAGGIIIEALGEDVRFVLSYACAVTVTNGAAKANTDYNVNGLHVYSTIDPELLDIEGTAYLAEGTPIEVYAYPTASCIHMTITNKGETVVDKNLDRIVAFVDDDKIEYFNYELAGDLVVTTTAEFTVNVRDEAQSEGVDFTVGTVDNSGETPVPVTLKDGDTLGAGEYLAARVVNEGADMLRLQAAREDGTLIEEVYIAPTTANGIIIPSVDSHVIFILAKAAAPLDAIGSLTLSKTAYSYTGTECVPGVTVTAAFGNDELTLVKDTDYSVTYKDNVNPGEASVTVTGLGSYTGTLSAAFTIKKASIAKATVTVKDQTYNGKAKTPAPTVKLGSVTLKKDTDYTVKYSSNKKVGTATVTITGKGNYSGTATAKFKIKAASIAKATVTVENQTYNGKAKTPAPTVKLGSVTLKKGTDYTVKYSSNKKVGTATVTITGKGNYKGTVKQTFKINKAQNPVTVKTATKTVRLAKVKKAKQTVTALTVSKAQGKVTYKKVSGSKYLSVNTNTGKVTVKKGAGKNTYTMKVKVTAAGNGSYKKLEETVTVTVKVK